MNNQKLGAEFEVYLANYLSEHGYFVHLLQRNHNGQPADLIAVKGGIADLIDCKTCNGRGLALSRIEDNQEWAMKKWYDCGNGNPLFACYVQGKIYMLSWHVVNYNLNVLEKSYISVKEIEAEGTPLEDWI